MAHCSSTTVVIIIVIAGALFRFNSVTFTSIYLERGVLKDESVHVSESKRDTPNKL